MENIILQFKNVNTKRGKFKLKNINLTLYSGYIYALAGVNGAGKTTLMNYILSEKVNYTGDILYNGMSLKDNYADLMNKIGFVSEDNVFIEDRTCKQNAEILGILYDEFDMEKFVAVSKQINVPIGATYKKMSRGEKIKFQMAFAMAHNAELYLLDEATAGMDPVFKIEFFKLLRELICDEKSCVFMTTHNEAEIVKNTDYFAIMKNGELGEFNESTEGMEGVIYD